MASWSKFYFGWEYPVCKWHVIMERERNKQRNILAPVPIRSTFAQLRRGQSQVLHIPLPRPKCLKILELLEGFYKMQNLGTQIYSKNLPRGRDPKNMDSEAHSSLRLTHTQWMTCHYYMMVPEETESNSDGSHEETATKGLLAEGQAEKVTDKEGGCTQSAGSRDTPTTS